MIEKVCRLCERIFFNASFIWRGIGYWLSLIHFTINFITPFYLIFFFFSYNSCSSSKAYKMGNNSMVDYFFLQGMGQFPANTHFRNSNKYLHDMILEDLPSYAKDEDITFIIEICSSDSFSFADNISIILTSNGQKPTLGRVYSKKGVTKFEVKEGSGFYTGCSGTRSIYCSRDSIPNDYRFLISYQDELSYFEIVNECAICKDQAIDNNCTREMIAESVSSVKELLYLAGVKK